MVLKRRVNGDGNDDQGSQLPIKRPNLVSYVGMNMQQYVMLQKWEREEIDRNMGFVLPGSSCNDSRNLQLQIHTSLPETVFTGSRVLSADETPIKIILYNTSTHHIITIGPLSSLKVSIVALDGDFGPDDREDWTVSEFNTKIVRNREGRRPLLTGELIVNLQGGVGYIREINFTDNSAWVRSGKFRLGVKATCHEISIREAMSNAFRVKDRHANDYMKCYPPSLNDDVWRLEKIAKDGASQKRLNEFGIYNVGDFLRWFFRDQSTLRIVLNVSEKIWETIVKHAKTCTLDENTYMYRTSLGIGLLFNSVYDVVGVTFDEQDYPQDYPGNLSPDHKEVVEEHKQHAYRNIEEWIPVFNPSIDNGDDFGINSSNMSYIF